MRRFLLSWLVWLTLGVTWLNTAVAFMPGGSLLSPSPNAVPALTQSHPGSGDHFFKETSSVSQELGLQCARQSKRAFVRVRSLHFSPRVWQRDIQLWSMAAPVSLPFLFFFPRKLSPPSAEADPFVS